MKRIFPALVLIIALLTCPVYGSWSSIDFSGGSLSGIAADGDTLLVTDVFNKVVWRVTDSGVEKAVGQISIPGLDGEPVGRYDDGTLETALFMEPWAITPFLEGFAVTDTEANVVRYFDDEGVFTAVGSGEAGSANGLGIKASFDGPTGLATGDDGEVYIADTGNGLIRVMNTGGQVSTWASGLVEPTGLYWADGSLYVAETGRNRICRVTDGEIETVVGSGDDMLDDVYVGDYVDGLLENARFDHPQGVAVSSDGTVYVADTGNHAVRKVADGQVTTVAVAADTPEAPVKPRSILLQDSSLVVTDLFAQNLLRVDVVDVNYIDVPVDFWAAEVIERASELGIIQGTGDGYFSPDDSVTRAMFATMLARVHRCTDGNAVIDGSAGFPDVPEDSWFGSSVRWAADQGIILGIDGQFMPDLNISREQLVTLLYRYASVNGHTLTGSDDLSRFTDSAYVSDYAVEAMQWAVGNGIVNGYPDGTLAPQAEATRAQSVQILMTAMDVLGI